MRLLAHFLCLKYFNLALKGQIRAPEVLSDLHVDGKHRQDLEQTMLLIQAFD